MRIFEFLPFLGKGRERETVVLLKQFTGIVHGVVAELKELFDALEGRDEKLLTKKIDSIDGLEHSADELRRQIEENLFLGAFLPMSRSQILNFAEKVDGVADAAQDVAHAVGFVRDIRIDKELMGTLKQSVDVTIECVSCLRNAVDDIDEKDKTGELINECRAREHDVDNVEKRAFQILYGRDYGPKQIILLSKLIEFIGNVSNNAEDASDALSLMMLMHKP